MHSFGSFQVSGCNRTCKHGVAQNIVNVPQQRQQIQAFRLLADPSSDAEWSSFGVGAAMGARAVA